MSLSTSIQRDGTLVIKGYGTGQYAIERYLGQIKPCQELPRIDVNGQKGHFLPLCESTPGVGTAPTASAACTPAVEPRKGIAYPERCYPKREHIENALQGVWAEWGNWRGLKDKLGQAWRTLNDRDEQIGELTKDLDDLRTKHDRLLQDCTVKETQLAECREAAHDLGNEWREIHVKWIVVGRNFRELVNGINRLVNGQQSRPIKCPTTELKGKAEALLGEYIEAKESRIDRLNKQVSSLKSEVKAQEITCARPGANDRAHVSKLASIKLAKLRQAVDRKDVEIASLKKIIATLLFPIHVIDARDGDARDGDARDGDARDGDNRDEDDHK